MKKFDVIRHDLYDKEETEWFTNNLTEHTADGYIIESCGISGDTARIGWAILSRSVEEKKFVGDLVEAARVIAEHCRNTDDCLDCPLCQMGGCLASCGRGKGTPSGWDILKEG